MIPWLREQANALWQRAAGFLRQRGAEGDQTYLLALAIFTGVAMGFVSAAFRWAINASHHFFFEASHGGALAFFRIPEEGRMIVVQALLPAFGGLVVGFVIYRLLGLGGGHGVPGVMRAVATGNTNLSPSMAAKSSSSIVTVTSGGSTGPEGPIVEIGSVVGSVIGRKAGMPAPRVATLIGCGAASGVAAVFNAPIGGVFLALELILRDFTSVAFGPIVLSAVVASVLSNALFPRDPTFSALAPEALQTISPNLATLAMFPVLGVLCGLASALLVRMLFRAHDFFHGLAVPRWLQPAVGGLGVGLVGIFFPTVIGEGYAFVNQSILAMHQYHDPSRLTLWAALGFLFVSLVKIFATSLTLGSGGTGGTFAPSMVTGACVGAGYGVLCNMAFPDLAPVVPVFALAGMAGCVGSTLAVPISAMLIIYEVSGAPYLLVLPLMATVAGSSVITALLGTQSVYAETLVREGFDLDEARRRAADPLARIRLDSIMMRDFIRLRPQDDLKRVLQAFTVSEDDAFAVIDGRERLVGLIAARDLRCVLDVGEEAQALIAADAADPSPPMLFPASTAAEALDLLSRTEAPAVAVVDSLESRKLVGLVGREAVLAALHREEAEKE